MSETQPFTITIDQARLDHVRRRLADFDWNGFANVGGWVGGLAKPVAQTLINRLATGFDGRSHPVLEHILAGVAPGDQV